MQITYPAPHTGLATSGGLSNGRRLKAILAGSLGNLIEWFDVYVYAFTSLYFSAAFFPESNPLVQVMSTSGIFAVGFVMRPVGGWYFGRYADRHGRQAAMVASVLLMGVGSLLIAILPGYATLGVFAPALLLLGRMLQGFSTGGQYGTAATYLSEIAGKSRRGFWSSFQYVTLIGGQLTASLLVVLLLQFFSDAEMKAYGWRIPFIVGGVAAFTLLLFRHHMQETISTDSTEETGSLHALVFGNTRALLTVIGLTAGGSLSFYTFTTYMQKYLVLTAGMTKESATTMMTGLLVIFTLVQPLVGHLSDTIGRRNNMLIFGLLATVATVPILAAIAQSHGGGLTFMLVLAGLLINSFYTSVSGLFKAELFPVHVRALGVGLAYGIGNALFGGTAEYVALAFKQAGSESMFYWYVTAICFVSLLTALTLKDTRKDNLLDEVAA